MEVIKEIKISASQLLELIRTGKTEIDIIGERFLIKVEED